MIISLLQIKLLTLYFNNKARIRAEARILASWWWFYDDTIKIITSNKIPKNMKRALKVSLGLLITIVLICSSCKAQKNNFFPNRTFLPALTYSATKSNPNNKILYTNDSEVSYLDSLKSKYLINFKSSKTQIDKVLTILNWTRSQWEHRGDVSPKKNDAISILDEVKEGGRFPCFAYGIVLASQLKVSGFKSRVIYLKTKDIATSMQGGGHVATEVFIDELQKWVFVDGQFNAMPFLNNVPLNAVELQNAIRTDLNKLEFRSLDKIDKMNYTNFVQEYLFYFDCAFDQRESFMTERNKVNGKKNLMLVPLRTENPTKMLVWDLKIDYCEYTNSINDFYAKPN